MILKYSNEINAIIEERKNHWHYVVYAQFCKELVAVAKSKIRDSLDNVNLPTEHFYIDSCKKLGEISGLTGKFSTEVNSLINVLNSQFARVEAVGSVAHTSKLSENLAIEELCNSMYKYSGPVCPDKYALSLR